MPIFTYFSVVGVALMALLFVANATLDKGPPPVTSSGLYGLPKPWKPEPTQTLTATTAPEPDMSSAAVQAAAPKSDPVPQQTAKIETAPKKKQHVAARKPQPGAQDFRQSFAWQPNSNPAGGGFFGRF
jgi:hypothetical protein